MGSDHCTKNMGCGCAKPIPEDVVVPGKPAIADTPASTSPKTKKGGAVPEAGPPEPSSHASAVLMGPPASGKGDVCKELLKTDIVQLSTVATFRRYLKQGGVKEADQAKAALDAGTAIPEDVMTTLFQMRVKEKDCTAHGWFMDGYPRTEAQATSLAAGGMKPKMLILLDLSDERVLEKTTLRRVDPETQEMYNLKDKPPPEDDAIKARLIARPDDDEARIKTQLKKYHDDSDGVLEAWKDILIKVDGDQDVDKVVADVKKLLGC